jgi:hypothetical protein
MLENVVRPPPQGLPSLTHRLRKDIVTSKNSAAFVIVSFFCIKKRNKQMETRKIHQYQFLWHKWEKTWD